ncbi:uncharacterized protein G2W53_018117 [Senna tora]|uniref:Uncharacterized protein n=1 Tax=Senna tora TaxID=362788 RepID=A0A834WN20_9FABA|nr:uncharacterized protein G2W53_018117 [Senna tora]
MSNDLNKKSVNALSTKFDFSFFAPEKRTMNGKTEQPRVLKQASWVWLA